MKKPLPLRQVHIDFHTSPFIEGIGERFTVCDKEVQIRTGRRPKEVIRIPEREPVEYSFEDGYTRIRFGKEEGYTGVYFRI
ncbi:MAG: hypothetical protein J5532_01350 [Lachnospiraceae bacterium]|nr:hypothetical protein [Lachnospiraceae bacterium]